MSSQISYTSTLPASLMKWLTQISMQHKTTKKAIIVHALSLYQDECKKKELAAGFRRAAQDPEILAMADEGLEDSLEQLKNFPCKHS